MFSIGDKVYYAIYREDGVEYNWSENIQLPKTTNSIKIISEYRELPNGKIMVRFDGYNYMLLLNKNESNIYRGLAVYDTRIIDENNKINTFKAFITKDWMSYNRESVLYLKRTLESLRKKLIVDNYYEWEYAYALSEYHTFLKRLETTNYIEQFPEDYL